MKINLGGFYKMKSVSKYKLYKYFLIVGNIWALCLLFLFEFVLQSFNWLTFIFVIIFIIVLDILIIIFNKTKIEKLKKQSVTKKQILKEVIFFIIKVVVATGLVLAIFFWSKPI